VVLWYMGYRPDHWFREDDARLATRQRVVALAAAILVLSAFLGVVTYDSYRTASFEQEVRGDVDALLEQPSHDQLTLLDVRFRYDDPVPPRQPTRVTVVAGRPAAGSNPTLARPLERRIDEALGDLALPEPLGSPNDVEVRVRYVEMETA